MEDLPAIWEALDLLMKTQEDWDQRSKAKLGSLVNPCIKFLKYSKKFKKYSSERVLAYYALSPRFLKYYKYTQRPKYLYELCIF